MLLQQGPTECRRMPISDPSFSFHTDRFRELGSPTPPANLPLPISVFILQGWMQLQYFTEPQSIGWNKLRYASEPPVPGAWNKLKYTGEP